MFSFKSNILNHDRHIEENRKFNCRSIYEHSRQVKENIKKKII